MQVALSSHESSKLGRSPREKPDAPPRDSAHRPRCRRIQPGLLSDVRPGGGASCPTEPRTGLVRSDNLSRWRHGRLVAGALCLSVSRRRIACGSFVGRARFGTGLRALVCAGGPSCATRRRRCAARARTGELALGGGGPRRATARAESLALNQARFAFNERASPDTALAYSSSLWRLRWPFQCNFADR